MIHPTAVIHPKAKIESSVSIGPYAVIDEAVTMGAESVVCPHVHITGQTIIGAHNHFHAGCVIGDSPQDLKYSGAPTRLLIGNNNIFREHVTVHRSNSSQEDTVIGSHNLFMAASHVGHNAVVGDYVVLVNGALLGGHVSVADRALISGHAMVHQFCRIGTLALMQGCTVMTKDLPPFCVANGLNTLCGLNIVGLRRAGFTPEQRLQLKRLYHALFRSGTLLSQAVEAAACEFTDAASRQMLDFIKSSKRGVCSSDGAETANED